MSETSVILSSIERLNVKHKAVRGDDGPFDSLALRTYRAIRWLERAAREHGSEDPDVAFILYWITFNAAYGKVIPGDSHTREREKFEEYFGQLLPLDRNLTIHNAIWEKFPMPIAIFLENKYLYRPYWEHINGKRGKRDWQEQFTRERGWVADAKSKHDTRTILTILFQRLYTLRNQLVHGGATWNSSLNRDGVQPGARIMEFLVPIFIEVMLDNPTEDWGPPDYPPGLPGGKVGR